MFAQAVPESVFTAGQSVLPLVLDIEATLDDHTGIIQYALVFLFAAIPVIEILVVIPIAIGLGLHPVITGVVAFAGNAGSVWAFVLGYRWIEQRWRGDGTNPKSGRHQRAKQLWDRYGVAGVSLAGPILTGVHIAAGVALVAGSRQRTLLVWMTLSIALWTVVFVLGSVFGFSLLGLLSE